MMRASDKIRAEPAIKGGWIYRLNYLHVEWWFPETRGGQSCSRHQADFDCQADSEPDQADLGR